MQPADDFGAGVGMDSEDDSDDDDDEEEEEEGQEGDDDLLPIEKASKKLRKKHEIQK